MRYWNSKFLGHATSDDLLKQFDSGLEGIDKNNILQVTFDGPNVNWAFFEKLKKQRTESELSDLVDIGSCNLHSIHNAFGVGVNATDWDIKKLMKGAFYTLHDTPARREDYIKQTGSKEFTLSFCATRFVHFHVQ